MVSVRPSTARDAAAVAAMLARAFDDDPVFAWMMPDAATRGRRLPALFAAFHADDAPPGLRLTTPGCEAATFWRAPGTTGGRPGPGDLWRAWRLLGSALWRGARVSEAIDAHFPDEPHWYLHIAGCDPAAQGRGLGRAVVLAGLAAAKGAPVYLETAKERNLPFYRGLGFHVTDSWSVPGGGPQFWSMIRPQD